MSEKAVGSVLGQDYGFKAQELKDIQEKIKGGEKLTEREIKYYDAYQGEVGARMSEYLLGNEAFIDKLVAKDASFAKKFVFKIQSLIDMFRQLGNSETGPEYKRLKKAESLYLSAARKAGDARLVKYILGHSPELEEEVDSDAQIVYNRKKTARYIPYEKVGDEVIRHIKTELKKIYNNEDGVADGIAIEHGSDVYIVDSGRENGSTTFGVRRRRRISDARARAEYIRRNNNESIRNGYISDGLSSKFGDRYDNDSGRNMRRESRTELQTDSRESQDNQGGVLGENADNGRVNDSDIRFNLRVGEEKPKNGQTSSNRGGDSESGGSNKQGIKYSLKNSEKVSDSKEAATESPIDQTFYERMVSKVLVGSKKAKVQSYVNSLSLTAAQKYMIMGYLGYKNIYGASTVKNYIQRLRMTKEQKETLYSYCGYAA